MKVSVLMATIGGSRLQPSLESLFAQQGVDLEVVLVNDNPSFVLPQVVRNLDQRLVLVHSERNMGLAGALNKGFESCTGQIIVRQDDDDLSMPGRLQKIVETFRATPDIDLLCSWAIGFARGSTKGRMMRTPRHSADLMRRIRFRNCIIHSTVAVTREAFVTVGGYSENFKYAQDYDFYLRAFGKGLNFHVIEEPLVEKYFDPGSVTLSRRTNQILHSLAAQCLYYGKRDTARREKWLILGNVLRLFTPNILRRILMAIRFR